MATVEGRHLHDRVHSRLSTEARGDILVARSLALVSRRLGLYGVADVVEFLRPVHAKWGSTLVRSSPGATGNGSCAVEITRGVGKGQRTAMRCSCVPKHMPGKMPGRKVLTGCIFYGKTRVECWLEFTQAPRDRVKR